MKIHSNEKGFTLLELLTVMTVISILAAIATRQISVYQARAFNARAEQDLRAAVAAEEAYFSENEVYIDCADSACEAALVGFILSNGTRLTLETRDDGEVYQGEASHPRGDKTYRFDSETSGQITAT